MNTLHDRLAELADDAPTGGAPPAELWARGKRANRVRAAALAVSLLAVVAAGTGIGVRVAEDDGNRDVLAPLPTVGFSLPIEYPVGEQLPTLGDAPGPLAAVWLSPRAGGGAPDAVGLVAKTGTFGTLPIALPSDDPGATQHVIETVALSPDGRKIAYRPTTSDLVVRDLVSGETYSPLSKFQTRDGFTWADATHLVGHVAGGSDGDGWVWDPGTAAKRVNFYDYLGSSSVAPYGRRDLWVFVDAGSYGPCSAPILENRTGRFRVPELCNVVVILGSDLVVGHWNSARMPGGWDDPHDGNRTVVALDVRGARTSESGRTPPGVAAQFDDPALRRVVVTARAPVRVAFAADLIRAALDADGGAS
jgi:hypothetical protein